MLLKKMEEILEKPLKYKNSKIGSFNMQKLFFDTWDQFNYIITKDSRVDKANLQKPDQFRSFIIRGLISNYVKDNWELFDAEEFAKWKVFDEKRKEEEREERSKNKVRKGRTRK